MAKFITGNQLNHELEELFENASEQIILISPYIKLHDRYISTLKLKIDKPKIKITVVFGKNEEDLSRSMKQEDFNFFKEFPNVEIRYEKRLHAKYYSNESYAILTSMNLYTFSQDNNIEFGVMTKTTLLEEFTNNLLPNFNREDFDETASNYFSRVINQSDLLFKKVPEYESATFGLFKKYKFSKIEIDRLTDFFANKSRSENNNRSTGFQQRQTGSQQVQKEGMETAKMDNSSAVANSNSTKLLSASAMAKDLGVSTKELNAQFEKLNYIEKVNDEWILTDLGRSLGAQIKKSQYGEYIAWPEGIKAKLN